MTVNGAHTVPGGAFQHATATFLDRHPIVPSSARGAYLEAESGEEYVDYVMGAGSLPLGHAHPDVVEAVEAQASEGTMHFLPTRDAYELTDRIADCLPYAERVTLSTTGSEAIFHALRLARAHTGREKILKFEGAYHGYHLLQSSRRADEDALARVDYPDSTIDSAGIPRGEAADVLVAPYNDLETTAEIVRTNASEIAGVILEPVMGPLPADETFLDGVRELCDRHGIVLIYDELVTGFRLALGGGAEYFGVDPDLGAYGKALNGGAPLTALAGTAEIMESLDPAVPTEEGGVYYSGTFNGGALPVAVSHATLDVLERSGTYDTLYDHADRLRTAIDDLFEDSPIPGRTTCLGPAIDFLVNDADEIRSWQTVLDSDEETKRAINEELLARNVLKLPFYQFVSTAHGDAELEATEEAYKHAIESVA